MTQLCYASTLFGAMTLAAAIDAGRLGPRPDRRILLVSNNAAIPEITPSLDESPGFAALRSRFDEVWSWNEIIAPLHPADWKARVVEVPMTGRLVRSYLGLGDAPDELIVESIAVPPSRTIAGLMRDCPITVYSDGLMSYGPTRDPLPQEISGRITRLLHLDLVPGLTPMLLTEYGVPAEPIADEAFRAVIDQVAGTAPADLADGLGGRRGDGTGGASGGDPGRRAGETPGPLNGAGTGGAATIGPGARSGVQAGGPGETSGNPDEAGAGRRGGLRGEAGGTGEVAMILGQYLSALGILTPAEEDDLHADLLRGVRARGHESVVFKPHPAAGRGHARRVRRLAEELGVRLTVAGETIPAEVCFAALRPGLVAGCFSTALSTAARYFGLPTAASGGELILERLTPYENSNRVPATIVDATVPRLAPDGTLDAPPTVDLPALIGAVGYCMQSAAHPGLHDAAAAYIHAHGTDRYFKRQRLSALGLLPARPTPPPPRTDGTLARLRRRLAPRS